MHAWIARDSRGMPRIGVKVCPDCDPEPSDMRPRRPFGVDGACPDCGGPGVVEWRVHEIAFNMVGLPTGIPDRPWGA
ncbi:hypothetical protein GCM10025787_03190 [Saccharopolyspora rosea]|uniref:Uncharacterized protein n=1 Tax=Saccharopolyspora rosea TaxID=524884 RepID=A0ABW3FMA6_9PSEU